MAKNDRFGTNGGNGGYAMRKPVTDTPNPQRTGGKKHYDYKGNNIKVSLIRAVKSGKSR